MKQNDQISDYYHWKIFKDSQETPNSIIIKEFMLFPMTFNTTYLDFNPMAKSPSKFLFGIESRKAIRFKCNLKSLRLLYYYGNFKKLLVGVMFKYHQEIVSAIKNIIPKYHELIRYFDKSCMKIEEMNENNYQNSNFWKNKQIQSTNKLNSDSENYVKLLIQMNKVTKIIKIIRC